VQEMQDQSRLQVRERDYDLYLSSLFIPKEYRSRIWSLQAFVLEMERISFQDSKIQALKYSFWINLFESSSASKVYPIADLTLISKNKLKRILASFLKNQNIATLQELEVEAEAKISQMFYLMLEILNVKDLKLDHGASHLGQAIGIIKVLQGTAFNINNTRIPTELWAKYKLSTTEIYRGNPAEIKKLKDLTFELGTRANDHLITSLKFEKEWNKSGFPVLLNYVAAKEYLRRLEKCDFDLFHVSQRSWSLPLKLLYYARRGVLR
jgi:NADH dehydrogenase [ubiquinone] 1 alpha subcomplex assembly factor 6